MMGARHYDRMADEAIMAGLTNSELSTGGRIALVGSGTLYSMMSGAKVVQAGADVVGHGISSAAHGVGSAAKSAWRKLW
jgi:hypothetical protein